MTKVDRVAIDCWNIIKPRLNAEYLRVDKVSGWNVDRLGKGFIAFLLEWLLDDPAVFARRDLHLFAESLHTSVARAPTRGESALARKYAKMVLRDEGGILKVFHMSTVNSPPILWTDFRPNVRWALRSFYSAVSYHFAIHLIAVSRESVERLLVDP